MAISIKTVRVRRHVRLATVLGVVLVCSGCANFRLTARDVETPIGTVGTFEAVYEGLPQQQKIETKAVVCRVCKAFLDARNQFRSLSTQPNPAGAYFRQLTEHYDKLVQRCVEARTILGECPFGS